MNKPLNERQLREIIVVTILIFATAISSIFAAYFYLESRGDKDQDFSHRSDLTEFIELYDRLNTEHYFEVDPELLIRGAIQGMVDAFEDKYTTYLDERDNYQFQQRVRGYYRGIGIGLYDNDDDQIEITQVFEGAPAYRADVKVGDIILAVDDLDLREKATADVVDYIRYAEEENVILKVLRDGEEIDLEIELETVVLPSVEGEIIEKEGQKIGYIEISIFASNTYRQFRDKLLELEEKEIDGLIIDLRYNTGGYLSVTEQIISMFLDDSKIIYRTEEQGDEKIFYSRTKESRDYPIVTLGNKYSASGSEILIAALQESYGAPFVGESTYGKGTVQELIDLDNDESLRYTARIWLTPEGEWIDGEGVQPDYEVEQNVDFLLTLEREDDYQFQKALKVFLELINN